MSCYIIVYYTISREGRHDPHDVGLPGRVRGQDGGERGPDGRAEGRDIHI